jgi:hypothetical protein
MPIPGPKQTSPHAPTPWSVPAKSSSIEAQACIGCACAKTLRSRSGCAGRQWDVTPRT